MAQGATALGDARRIGMKPERVLLPRHLWPKVHEVIKHSKIEPYRVQAKGRYLELILPSGLAQVVRTIAASGQNSKRLPFSPIEEADGLAWDQLTAKTKRTTQGQLFGETP